MTLIAAMIYWVIVAIWLTVLGTLVLFYIRNPRTFGTTRLLLAALCIDTFRNVFENIYFGLYFGSIYEFFPSSVAAVMGVPIMLIVPKVLNVIAGIVVLALLLGRWLPMAIKEHGRAEQRASDLETLAAVDFLTGLYNRSHFETLATSELARSQRYMRPLSILVIDIDHFKSIHVQLGQAAGDRVLKNVAALCLAQKRDSDGVARLGGNQFAFMLPETTEVAAVEFAERLRLHVRENARTVDGQTVNVTISIGIAAASLATSSVKALMQQADAALRQAKQWGRDQVVVYRIRDSEGLDAAAE